MIVKAFSTELNTKKALENIANDLKCSSSDTVLTIFFISDTHDLKIIESFLSENCHGHIMACTTAGEISNQGNLSNSISAICFKGDDFKIHSLATLNLAEFPNKDEDTELVQIEELVLNNEKLLGKESKSFGILLIDGMSIQEERYCSIIGSYLKNIPLIGGSAGDNVKFENTYIYVNGRFQTNAASLVFLTTTVPFSIFKTQHFKETNRKLVITDSVPDKRIVQEINGEPAVDFYLEQLGLKKEELTPNIFSKYPLMLRLGNENFVRSVQKANDDGSLVFYCAIETGLVLTMADKEDLFESNQKIFNSLLQELKEIDTCLLFECILRRLEFDESSKENKENINKLYSKFGCCGFHTYGEQYGNVHINQTLTGVAFGKK